MVVSVSNPCAHGDPFFRMMEEVPITSHRTGYLTAPTARLLVVRCGRRDRIFPTSCGSCESYVPGQCVSCCTITLVCAPSERPYSPRWETSDCQGHSPKSTTRIALRIAPAAANCQRDQRGPTGRIGISKNTLAPNIHRPFSSSDA